MASSDANNAAPSQKPKKPLFKKLIISQPVSSYDDDDFFSRSHRTYGAVAEEDEAKKKRKEARKEVKRRLKENEHAADDGGEGEAQEWTESVPKRRKLFREKELGDSGDSEYSSDEEPRKSTEKLPRRNKTKSDECRVYDDKDKAKTDSKKSKRAGNSHCKMPKLARAEDKSQSVKVSREQATSPAGSSRNVIHLDEGDKDEPLVKGPQKDDDDDTALEIVEVKTTKKPTITARDDYLDDDFAELARKAREAASERPPDKSSSPRKSIASGSGVPASEAPLPSGPPDQDAGDPIVQILIDSPLPDTYPLIIKYRLSRPLKVVRRAWCDYQHFTDEAAAGVILTWRGRRLYDFTSCRSLGIGVDTNGELVAEGQKDSFGEENRQIHFEAMTKEVFEERRLAKEKAIEKGSLPQEVDEQPSAEEQLTVPYRQTRVILKAKDLPDFKLIVKNDTVVSRILKAFRQNHGVAAEKAVTMMFDGEVLEPTMTIEQTELSDMDHIHVYVR